MCDVKKYSVVHGVAPKIPKSVNEDPTYGSRPVEVDDLAK